MSPILVRPVREQLEHDRVIRLLHAKYKRKFEVAINPGNAQTMPVGTGASAWYPDLVLQSMERGRRLLGVVEVETAESVNHLEAMSQWAAFARLRAPFHLYVPASNIETARRLCADLRISVAEIWAYASLGDQMRFNLVQRAAGAGDGRARSAGDGKVHRPAGSAEREREKPKAPVPSRAAKRAPAPAPRKTAASRSPVAVKAPARRTVASKAAPRAKRK